MSGCVNAIHCLDLSHSFFQKLLQQGSELCTESLAVLNEATSSIPWLEQLATKLQTEIDFLRSLLDSTEALVTDTYQCYLTLDQVRSYSSRDTGFYTGTL